MATSSSIEWTEVTWNPVTGCDKVSAGCKFCYAERMARRLKAMGVPQYRNGFRLTLAPKTLPLPYEWKKPKLVFVNSMSDLFHDAVPLSYIQRVFKVMNETPRHTYQILTKRAERLRDVASKLYWSRNIWMGVSVENAKVKPRIVELSQVPAAIRFLSIEPLIDDVGALDLDEIDWVIVGGESGPGARPVKKEWIDNIFDQCRRAKVKLFFKQWGKAEFNVDQNDPTILKSHPWHAKGGCLLNGRLVHEMPVHAM